MTAPLVDRNTGDLIPASDHNDVKDYIEDGTYRVNSLSLSIGGTEIIDSSRGIKPVKVIAPDSGGIVFYASDGNTQIGVLDDNGNFGITGRFYTI